PPRNQAPVVNLRVLHNRDLTAALMMFLVLGFGLYGGLFLFPLFVQGALHFTPTQTGMILLPGGIATGLSAAIAGRILNGPKPLLDYRILIVFGLVVFSFSMWDLAHLTLQSGLEDTR